MVKWKTCFQQTVGSVMHLTEVMNVQNMIQQRNENKTLKDAVSSACGRGMGQRTVPKG